jgi:hypothetical protein
MSTTVKNFLATLIAAAIIANCTFLWQVNSRLTSIEVKIEYIGAKTIASK